MATKKKSRTLFTDVWDFLRERKAWWLLPIVVMLSLMGVLMTRTVRSLPKRRGSL